jgi:hypothetical protein
MGYCPKCRRTLLGLVPQRRHFSRSPAYSYRGSQKPRSSTNPKVSGSVVAVAFGWLRRQRIKEQTLLVLTLGLLLMLAVVFSAIRGGGEEYKGELRTKSLVYESNDNGRIGLHWMDDKGNLRKATPDEIRRCEKLHPDERIPICQTIYYEKDENR